LTGSLKPTKIKTLVKRGGVDTVPAVPWLLPRWTGGHTHMNFRIASSVLGCMGPPAAKAAEGAAEVWSYGSGNGQVTTVGVSQANANAYGGPGYATGSATGFGWDGNDNEALLYSQRGDD
jgi:hypothetical protein